MKAILGIADLELDARKRLHTTVMKRLGVMSGEFSFHEIIQTTMYVPCIVSEQLEILADAGLLTRTGSKFYGHNYYRINEVGRKALDEIEQTAKIDAKQNTHKCPFCGTIKGEKE